MANPWTTFNQETVDKLQAQLKPALVAYGESKGYATFRIERSGFIDWREFSYELAGLKYDDLLSFVTPDATSTTDFINDSSTEDSVTWSVSSTTTDTFTWSMTEGLKVGVKTSFKVKAPIVAEGKVEVSTELNFQATETQTVTKTRTWSETVLLKIPPFSTVHATAAVMTANYDTPFEARLRLSGDIYFNQGEANWAKQEHVSTEDPEFRKFLSPGAPELIVMVRGEWKGVLGIKLVVEKKARKLEDMIREFAEQVTKNFETWRASGDGEESQ